MTDARAQFVDAMERDPADHGLEHANRQATEAVRGLLADGPVRLVTEELARLDREAKHAEQAKAQTETIDDGKGPSLVRGVEPRGIEPLTFSLRTKRSTN